MSEKLIPSTAVRDECMRVYELKDRVSDKTLKQELMTICKKIPVKRDGKELNLWEAIYRPQSENGKTTHYFAEYEKNLLFESDDFKKYVMKQHADRQFNSPFMISFAEEYDNKEKYRKKAEELRKRSYQSHFESHEEHDNAINETYATLLKIEFMLEAIFEQFYEPFDDDLLRKHLKLCAIAGSTDEYNAKVVKAFESLKDFKNYCKEKSKE